MNFFNDATALYIAMGVALSVWIVLFVYLWRLDAYARELRRRLDQRQPGTETLAAPRATLTSQTRNSRPVEPTTEPGK